jgi:hypothetical protein
MYILLLPEGKLAKPRNLIKNSALSEIGEHWIERYFYFSLKEL